MLVMTSSSMPIFVMTRADIGNAEMPQAPIIGLIFFFLLNQMQGGGNRVMGFGKSKAKLATKDTPRTTFSDVAGADEEKEELQEIVDFLKAPGKFIDLGARKSIGWPSTQEWPARGLYGENPHA